MWWCGPFLGAAVMRGQGEEGTDTAYCSASLPVWLLPVTCHKQAWLFVKRWDSTRAYTTCFRGCVINCMALELQTCILKLGTYCSDCRVVVCALSKKLAITCMGRKVPRGCGTLPLLLRERVLGSVLAQRKELLHFRLRSVLQRHRTGSMAITSFNAQERCTSVVCQGRLPCSLFWFVCK